MTKPTIDIYVADFIEDPAEREFLRKLYADLKVRDVPFLIFANFFAGKGNHQIDFFVVTPLGSAHIELKNFIGPFGAKARGPWLFKNSDGTTTQIERRNPFLQARNGTIGISDEMRSLAKSDETVPKPNNKGFYSFFDTFICVFPNVHPASEIDHFPHVEVLGYEALLARLTNGPLPHSWPMRFWERFATSHLALSKIDLTEIEYNPAYDQANGAGSAGVKRPRHGGFKSSRGDETST